VWVRDWKNIVSGEETKREARQLAVLLDDGFMCKSNIKHNGWLISFLWQTKFQERGHTTKHDVSKKR
jgi:hypothetical protein